MVAGQTWVADPGCCVSVAVISCDCANMSHVASCGEDVNLGSRSFANHTCDTRSLALKGVEWVSQPKLCQAGLPKELQSRRNARFFWFWCFYLGVFRTDVVPKAVQCTKAVCPPTRTFWAKVTGRVLGAFWRCNAIKQALALGVYLSSCWYVGGCGQRGTASAINTSHNQQAQLHQHK